LENNFANPELFKIIVDGRNEVVANEIINSEHDKMIVTY
jgi:pheromone shutdown protein TraB